MLEAKRAVLTEEQRESASPLPVLSRACSPTQAAPLQTTASRSPLVLSAAETAAISMVTTPSDRAGVSSAPGVKMAKRETQFKTIRWPGDCPDIVQLLAAQPDSRLSGTHLIGEHGSSTDHRCALGAFCPKAKQSVKRTVGGALKPVPRGVSALKGPKTAHFCATCMVKLHPCMAMSTPTRTAHATKFGSDLEGQQLSPPLKIAASKLKQGQITIAEFRHIQENDRSFEWQGSTAERFREFERARQVLKDRLRFRLLGFGAALAAIGWVANIYQGIWAGVYGNMPSE